MKAYLDLLSHILEFGEEREDRTNTGTLSSFGHQLEFDLKKGFPAVTTKSLASVHAGKRYNFLHTKCNTSIRSSIFSSNRYDAV